MASQLRITVAVPAVFIVWTLLLALRVNKRGGVRTEVINQDASRRQSGPGGKSEATMDIIRGIGHQ